MRVFEFDKLVFNHGLFKKQAGQAFELFWSLPLTHHALSHLSSMVLGKRLFPWFLTLVHVDAVQQYHVCHTVRAWKHNMNNVWP
jgi:hypothetical protein